MISGIRELLNSIFDVIGIFVTRFCWLCMTRKGFVALYDGTFGNGISLVYLEIIV